MEFGESSMVTAEVKEEQEVYVYLPSDYDEGKHILSCVLSHFPKDGTKIIAFSIIPAKTTNSEYNELLDQCWERCNETLDKHLAQCTIQEFKAERLIHRNDSTVKGILELIDLWAVKNLVMGFSPNSKIPGLVKEKANPLCKIWFIHKGYLIFTRCPNSGLTEASSEEVKEEQKVYVFLTSIYDDEEHILSWALSHFPKDGTQIVATSIIPPPSKQNAMLNQWRERSNETLDKHLAQCAIQKFKAEKLIHEKDDVVEGILELIDLRAMENLVMGFPPNSEVAELVKEKANPSCKIWFIQNGNLIYSRYPNSDLTEASSEELIRMEKLHQKKIEKIRKRENDKNDLLQRENEQLKLENQLLREQRNDEELKKQQLRKLVSDKEMVYTKLKQEHDYIKKALELIKPKEHSFAKSDMVLSCQFSLSELKQATQNFNDSLKIGEGVFGCVYKGSLRKTTVAIKKLNLASSQGSSEFQQEVAILTRVRHPNIVNLIGSCSEISALVYEFLPNGSLEDRLKCADNTSSLTWQARIRIISEICLGLVFLHSNKPHLVIHGDLKPDNILLDANFISKLSDFGISWIIKQSDTNTTALHRTTHLAGKFAYIDPEFLSTEKLTPKSDVYSFGIIVLRLLTGKPAEYIASKVQEAMQTGKLLSIVDQSAGKWPSDLAKKLAKLGLRCADTSRAERPDMSQAWATIEPLVKGASLSSVGSSTFNEEHVPSHFMSNNAGNHEESMHCGRWVYI